MDSAREENRNISEVMASETKMPNLSYTYAPTAGPIIINIDWSVWNIASADCSLSEGTCLLYNFIVEGCENCDRIDDARVTT
ncbi:hypothetical protein BBO01nite_48800 [Brevibacillus borstelensis]|nr:hypothetical protein BBO01nite_48800 [Brevibacillus borstelensis]